MVRRVVFGLTSLPHWLAMFAGRLRGLPLNRDYDEDNINAWADFNRAAGGRPRLERGEMENGLAR